MQKEHIEAARRATRGWPLWPLWPLAAWRRAWLITGWLLAACGGGSPDPSPAQILYVHSSWPEPGSTIRTDAVLQIRFSEPLDRATATTDNVRLSSAGQAVAATVRVDGDMLYVTPVGRLRLKTDYLLTITPGLKTPKGVGLQQAHEIPMHTARAVFLVEAIVPMTDVASGGEPNPMMAVTDLDRDGLKDLVVASRLTTYVPGMAEDGYILQTYRQGMQAQFTRIDRMEVRLGEQHQDVEYPAFFALDVDHDGSDEIVMAEYQMRENAADVVNWPVTGLRIFKRQSGGGWRQWQYLRTAYVESVRLGDVDGDGHADLVGTRGFDADGRVYGYRDSGFQVMLSRPGGLQLRAPVVGLLGTAFSVLTDMDRDGDLDLLLSPRPGYDVYTNDGAGVFSLDPLRSALMPPLFEGFHEDPVVIHLNTDGWPDFVMQGPIGTHWVSDAQGRYAVSASPQLPGMGGGLVPEAGDLDGDGYPDLMWMFGAPLSPTAYMPLFGRGDASLEWSPMDIMPGYHGSSFMVDDRKLVDMNADGHLDVLVANSNTGVLLLRLLPD
jgi:hypothetical protein